MNDTLLVLAGIGGALYIIYFIIMGEKNKKTIPLFENKMIRRGFTRRVVVYDFLSESKKSSVNDYFRHSWFVGIWLNYPGKMIAIRRDKDIWEEADIPFDKIQSVEIIKDGHTITTGGGIGAYGLFVGGATSKEVIKELQVRIVTGDIYSGTMSYIINLYDSTFSSKANPDMKAIKECARSIADEINNIMNHAD